MLKTLTESIAAGFLIAIGGCAALACENKYVGALLFSVALLCICYMGYYLYTGKIGYLATELKLRNVVCLSIGLIGNLLTVFSLGFLIRTFIPKLGVVSEANSALKLSQSFSETLVRAFFCGILMYLAVHIFKEKQTPIGIVFCVPVFILSGFEHSIADMFYFGAAGFGGFDVLLFETAAVLGNSLGSLLLPLLMKVSVGNEKNAG